MNEHAFSRFMSVVMPIRLLCLETLILYSYELGHTPSTHALPACHTTTPRCLCTVTLCTGLAASLVVGVLAQQASDRKLSQACRARCHGRVLSRSLSFPDRSEALLCDDSFHFPACPFG